MYNWTTVGPVPERVLQMTDVQQPSSQPIPSALPDVRTSLAAPEVVERLERLSKRGKLPGFARGSGQVLFSVEAYATPFEGVVEAHAETTPQATLLRFSYRMLTRLPAIFAVICVLTVWPGVILTDSLMKTYFPAFTESVPTAWWYLPLTVLPFPWMWMSWLKKSRAMGIQSAQEQVAKISAELLR